MALTRMADLNSIKLLRDCSPCFVPLPIAITPGTRDRIPYLGISDDPNPIAAAFGVQYLPAIFLIGPDGRVIARDLDSHLFKQAVADALARVR
jgi:hypothetical protein